jgi:hypothetical protein
MRASLLLPVVLLLTGCGRPPPAASLAPAQQEVLSLAEVTRLAQARDYAQHRPRKASRGVEETAHVLGRSPRTVKREWQLAKAWLFRELHVEGAQPSSRP